MSDSLGADVASHGLSGRTGQTSPLSKPKAGLHNLTASGGSWDVMPDATVLAHISSLDLGSARDPQG